MTAKLTVKASPVQQTRERVMVGEVAQSLLVLAPSRYVEGLTEQVVGLISCPANGGEGDSDPDSAAVGPEETRLTKARLANTVDEQTELFRVLFALVRVDEVEVK
jgi:hypothetical protein